MCPLSSCSSVLVWWMVCIVAAVLMNGPAGFWLQVVHFVKPLIYSPSAVRTVLFCLLTVCSLSASSSPSWALQLCCGGWNRERFLSVPNWGRRSWSWRSWGVWLKPETPTHRVQKQRREFGLVPANEEFLFCCSFSISPLVFFRLQFIPVNDKERLKVFTAKLFLLHVVPIFQWQSNPF